MAADPKRSVTSICEHLGISRPTYYRYISPEMSNIAENNP
ncbi:helix-turn-helix domain-containing protein [Leptolyngbya sp. FACHB-711]